MFFNGKSKQPKQTTTKTTNTRKSAAAMTNRDRAKWARAHYHDNHPAEQWASAAPNMDDSDIISRSYNSKDMTLDSLELSPMPPPTISMTDSDSIFMYNNPTIYGHHNNHTPKRQTLLFSPNFSIYIPEKTK